ncbi:MAG: class I SAM-dependent methyltransferase [Pseudomonadota bacterium]
MNDENALLKQALLLDGSPDMIRKFYEGWSHSYDTDLVQDIGYIGPEIVADALCKKVSKSATILDAGCGTGLVGVELLKRKPGLIVDGIDLTPAMLAQSREKGVYRKLSEADLNSQLTELAHDFYDGTVSAGVFTNGHVGPNGLDGLIRVTKPGAPIVLTVRDSAWEADGFKDKIEQLESEHRTRTGSVTHSPYHTNEGIYCQLVVLEVI